MITVQTAFLKCHYPEEYMTALLSVQRDDLGKVSTFLEECRRMNIPILPPDVNFSQLDFDIESTQEGRRPIRFGLAAVKNAGAQALEELVAVRGEAPFSDLMDFCQRVDMRQLGKRTLESLIKVGALDAFGTRSSMLAAIDRIVSYSSNYHKDQEIGQMDLFGEEGQLDADLLDDLRDIEEYRPRELLKWEKELLGLYITGRPVDRHRDVFAGLNLYEIADLKRTGIPKPDKVRIAGELTAVRKITTRNSDLMAILSLEDWHDSADTIEIVLFPRTPMPKSRPTSREKTALWPQGENQMGLIEGEIVAVMGRYDDSRGDPQIIAEKVTVEFNSISGDGGIPEAIDETTPVWAMVNDPASESGAAEQQLPTDEAAAANDIVEESEHAAKTEQPAESARAAVETPPVEPVVDQQNESEPEWANGDEALAMPDEDVKEDIAPRTISVVMQASQDPEKDRRKLTRIVNALLEFPGQDSFRIIIKRDGRATPLVFPDKTTAICDELLRSKLQRIVADEQAITIAGED